MDYGPCRRLFSKFARKRLLAGFSGGADSTALLLVSDQLAKEYDCRLTAVHFDHHLRGAESGREARDARAFCKKRGIEFLKVDLDVPRDGNLEAAARAARLAAWKRLIAEHRAAAVIVGHHADDRAENLFLRLARGANATGLTSLREVSVVDGIVFLRPLLGWTRREILRFLADEKIDRFAEDSSNGDFRFFRNRLRGEILPALYGAFPGCRGGVSASLQALECDARFLEDAAEKSFRANRPESAAFWRGAPEALLPRLLRLYVQKEFGADFIPTGADCRRLLAELQKTPDRPRKITFSDGYRIVLTKDSFLPEEPPPSRTVWEWRKNPSCVWGRWEISVVPDDGGKCSPSEARFDADALPDALVLSAAGRGETMTPFGCGNARKIKKLRADRKIPACPAPPVLRDDRGNVLWAVAVRQSAFFSVSGTTRRSVRFAAKSAISFPARKRR